MLPLAVSVKSRTGGGVLARVREREQTGQTCQLGIHSQDRFSKWFLFFKSSSSSPHRNPLNLKNKQVKKSRFPLSQQVQLWRRGSRASPSNTDGFPSGLCLWDHRTEAREDCPMERSPFLSFPLSSPALLPSPIYNLSVILVITLYVFSWVFIISNARECLTLNTSWNDRSFLP